LLKDKYSLPNKIRPFEDKVIIHILSDIMETFNKYFTGRG